ncbi:hypothetical protein UL59_10040, partial [Shigella boydii]
GHRALSEHKTLSVSWSHYPGNDMFYQLFASDDAYYPTLSWQPLADYPTCPETLKDMSDL